MPIRRVLFSLWMVSLGHFLLCWYAGIGWVGIGWVLNAWSAPALPLAALTAFVRYGRQFYRQTTSVWVPLAIWALLLSLTTIAPISNAVHGQSRPVIFIALSLSGTIFPIGLALGAARASLRLPEDAQKRGAIPVTVFTVVVVLAIGVIAIRENLSREQLVVYPNADLNSEEIRHLISLQGRWPGETALLGGVAGVHTTTINGRDAVVVTFSPWALPWEKRAIHQRLASSPAVGYLEKRRARK